MFNVITDHALWDKTKSVSKYETLGGRFDESETPGHMDDIVLCSDSSKMTLNDLRSAITEAAKEDARFKRDGDENQFEAYCSEILRDEKAGKWSTVIWTGTDLFEVPFTLAKDGEVKLASTSKKVIHRDQYISAKEKEFKFNGEKIESVGTTTLEPEEIVHCVDAGVPLEAEKKKWEQGKPIKFMWAPAGVKYIRAGCAGRSIQMWITGDKKGADQVQESFTRAVESSPRRAPFGCVEHHEEERAFTPKKFTWEEKPEPGIYCTALPTKLGQENVNGELHTSFSPCFKHDAKFATAVCTECDKKSGDCNCDGVLTFPEGVRGSESNPARIIGVSEKSVGSLTNWPAFKDILPVTAKEPETTMKAKSKENKTSEKPKVNEIKAEAIKAFEKSAEAEFEPDNKEHSKEASMHAEEATKNVEMVKEDENKSEAHHWAAKAHECAGRACDRQGDWTMSNHHSNQASLHNRYAHAADDEKHPEHSRAINFKASEPDLLDRVKIIKAESHESIYDRIVIIGQPAGRN